VLRHWVGMMCLGATALVGSFRACEGNLFAVVHSHTTVLVNGFSNGGMQCTSGAEDASRRLILGCGHYASEVQGASGA
jgi:hypothetical protein